MGWEWGGSGGYINIIQCIFHGVGVVVGKGAVKLCDDVYIELLSPSLNNKCAVDC